MTGNPVGTLKKKIDILNRGGTIFFLEKFIEIGKWYGPFYNEILTRNLMTGRRDFLR